MDKKIIGYILLLGIVLAVAVWGLWYMDQQAAPKREAYADLAQCLSESDVTFYGAFWCPACAQQKAMFDGSVKKLPYKECSLPDRTQNEMCVESEITNYPVWEFEQEDGGKYRCGGVTSPEILAHVSGCALPTYEGIDNTVAGLYKRLIVDTTTDSLKKRGVPLSTIQETIESATEAVDTYLTDNHGTTTDSTDSVEHLLNAIAETLHNCAPYEKQEEVEESESIEIELAPEGEVDSESEAE